MKIKDLLKLHLPITGKLTKGFTLEESFDPNMILNIRHIELEKGWNDGDNECYKVFVTMTPEQIEYNKTVALHDWLDEHSNPTLNIFEAQKNFRGFFKSDGSIQDTIFVMESDDFFELESNNTKIYTAKEVEELFIEAGNRFGMSSFNAVIAKDFLKEKGIKLD